MGQAAKRPAVRSMDAVPIRSSSRQNRVKKLPRIVSAQSVIHGVLKIVWNDGYEGIVDLRPTIARGRIFTYLQNPKNFAEVCVSEYGHSIEWINDRGQEIDFGADTLRSKAENQARLNEVASILQY
ncbi:MAG: hypothetical protein WBF58_21160 [Xanthobacteraceae bacterium]